MPKLLSYFFLTLPFLLVLLHSPTSHATFFPNISSLPPELLHPNLTNPWDAFRNLSHCREGDRLPGLAQLKNYFHYFGYIQNVSGNFSEDFDDELLSAIKTYQKNFNLNVTGLLDNQTLSQIVRPRCGNADVVNGTTTMNSRHTTSSLHTVAHYTFFPGTPRWSKTDLTYAFLPDNQLSDEVKTVFSRAFQRWSEVIPLTFTETSDYSSADIKVGFYGGDHGDGEPFDGVLGTLAHAFSPPSGRLHLDAAENWVVSGDVSTSGTTSAVDLESVAVHEIGHLLGLGHSSVEDAIMYPTISSRTKKVILASDDVEGVQSLYGSNPNYNGTTSTVVQQRDTSGAFDLHVSKLLLYVVVLVTLFL